MLTRVRWWLHRLAHPDRDLEVRTLRKEVRRLGELLEKLQAEHRRLEESVRRSQRPLAQARLAASLNRQQQDEIAGLPRVLDEGRIGDHFRAAVVAAPLLTEPYEHVIVERAFPDDVYDLLVRALPAAEFFPSRDPIKQNLKFPMEVGPTLATSVWTYMDSVIAARLIRPVVMEKFREALRRYYESLFGSAWADRAAALPPSVQGGRLMLRRPGYRLPPHRDPKRAMLTCLLYLARPGDSETYGTQIFRVAGDQEAGYAETYYPEEDGRPCELVKTVPFRPNTMLVSLNAWGAHGAVIPDDAPHVERYAYQFYVGPDVDSLNALIETLPPERRLRWRTKAEVLHDGRAEALR